MSKCKTPDNCRISRSATSTTCMYFPPVYDGHGNNLNPDRNTSSYTEHCSTCGKVWSISECGTERYKTLVPDNG